MDARIKSVNSTTANNMVRHEEEQVPGRAIRMYMKSIAQATRNASPMKRRKDESSTRKNESPIRRRKGESRRRNQEIEEKEKECPVQQEAKEQQSPKEIQKPMTEKEQFLKPIDFRISASNSLLASSSDREIERTDSVPSKKNTEQGDTQKNAVLDSIGLNRQGKSTPSNHINVQYPSSPAHSENSLSFRRMRNEKNVRETPTSVSATSGPSPKGRSPRLPWKGSFGKKRLLKKISKSPLRKKQDASTLQEAEQNQLLLPTPGASNGAGDLPAESPFHQHSQSPHGTDNE